MEKFWQKSIFWVLLFLILIILIPLGFYMFKEPILSQLPRSLIRQTQDIKVIKPGHCLILEEKYCSQGEVIRTKNSQDGPEIYIGFNLPAGIPIFAGMDGQALKIQLAQPSEFQGYRVTVLDPNLGNSTKGFVVIGDLRFKDMLSQSVKVGQEIAQTQNTGIKNLDYNILITVRQATAKDNTPIPHTEVLQKLFTKIQ